MKSKVYVLVGIISFFVGGLLGCDQPIKAPDNADTSCRVAKFTLDSEDAPEPVCVIECSWARITPGDWGFAHAVNVPCSWYGGPVSRHSLQRRR